jgi:hypothetical protein
MPQPEKIGKVGTVRITYRKGQNGQTTVAGMPQWDFERLQNLVAAYEGHEKALKELEGLPYEAVRKEARKVLGITQPSPRRGAPLLSKPFEFPVYDVRGMFKRTAVNERKVTLYPKHIQQVVFINAVNVTN